MQVSAFMKRFSSLEAMVREVVPGADRKLREHQENNLVGLWEIYPSEWISTHTFFCDPG